jgi:hypothetical protein
MHWLQTLANPKVSHPFKEVRGDALHPNCQCLNKFNRKRENDRENVLAINVGENRKFDLIFAFFH